MISVITGSINLVMKIVILVLGIFRVFLVRESHSIHGVYVLSLAHNYKVKHCQIHKVCVDNDNNYYEIL